MKSFTLISNRGPDFTSGEKKHAAVGGTKDAYAHLMDEFCDSWTCIAPEDLSSQSVNSQHGDKLNVVFVEREKYRNYYYKFVSECLYPALVGWPEKIRSADKHQDFLDVSAQVAASALRHAPGKDVLICDYHLYRLPEIMRQNGRTVFFWYIPFHQNYAESPLTKEIVDSMSKCDDIVFLHQQYADNFAALHDRLTNGSELKTKLHAITLGPHENFADTEAIPYENFSLLLKKYFGIESEKSKKYLVSVARMDFVKSIPLLLEAYRKFIETETGAGTELLLILPPHRPGSEMYDEEERKIRGLLETMPTNRVRVHWQSLPREEIKTLYKFSQAFIVSSRHDGMPLTPFEFALANEGAGDLVLSNGIGAHALLDGHAFSFEKDNAESLSAALMECMQAPESDKRSRMEKMREISHTITLHQWLNRVALLLNTSYPTTRD